MITEQEWSDWVNSPVTQAVLARLQNISDELVNDILALSLESSPEEYGIRAMTRRTKIDGLGEILDLDDLKESIVDEPESTGTQSPY